MYIHFMFAHTNAHAIANVDEHNRFIKMFYKRAAGHWQDVFDVY